MSYIDLKPNEVMVKAILDFLIEAFEKFSQQNPDYSPIDLFMGVHNFHVVTVLSIERDMGITDTKLQLFLREMAVETFKKAMEDKPPFEEEK